MWIYYIFLLLSIPGVLCFSLQTVNWRVPKYRHEVVPRCDLSEITHCFLLKVEEDMEAKPISQLIADYCRPKVLKDEAEALISLGSVYHSETAGAKLQRMYEDKRLKQGSYIRVHHRPKVPCSKRKR